MEFDWRKDTPKLGFGLMRLPKGADGKADLETTKEMVDQFMEAGMTYFDTAYVYDDGGSERVARAALVERYPRDSFTLATKLCAWRDAPDEESAKRQLYTSLERTGADYFDYYLLHAVQVGNVERYDNYHLWDFVRAQKEKGLIRRWGFSFHAGPELLDKLLTEHPDADFVQLQLNYADWESPGVAARANYQVARRHNKPIVVMEPVKGGVLAQPPQSVRDILTRADPEASLASWAIRYAASLEGVLTVLSGMSTPEQMADNLSYMRRFQPLDAGELEVIRRTQQALSAIDSIPCTGCRYCVAGCPKHIPIPQIFSARNRQLLWGRMEESQSDYDLAVKDAGRASDCVACGQCERVCPQQIDVIDRLRSCAGQFDR